MAATIRGLRGFQSADGTIYLNYDEAGSLDMTLPHGDLLRFADVVVSPQGVLTKNRFGPVPRLVGPKTAAEAGQLDEDFAFVVTLILSLAAPRIT